MVWFGDSGHVFHVSKAGNDANGGLAQQYPVSLANDSKLTVNSALTEASNGDKIVVWPGTYTEALDFYAVTKSLHLIGTNRYLSKITSSGASTETLKLYDKCTVENIFIEHTGGYRAITGEGQEHLRFIDCQVITDGENALRCQQGNNLYVKNCYLESGYVTLMLGGNLFVEDSFVLSTGLQSGITHAVALEINDAPFFPSAIVRNTRLIACPAYRLPTGKSSVLYQTDAQLLAIHDVATHPTKLIIDNCLLLADGYYPSGAHADSYANGDSTALNNGPGSDEPRDYDIIINNSILFSRTDQNYNKTAYGMHNCGAQIGNSKIVVTGQLASYDFHAPTTPRTIYLANTKYNSSQIGPNITVHTVPDDTGRVDADTTLIEGVDATDQIGDAVWDELTAGHTTAGSAGARQKFISDCLEGDVSIDTSTTPWQMVVKIKGTSTELIRKDLKDINDANLTAISSIIGKRTEP